MYPVAPESPVPSKLSSRKRGSIVVPAKGRRGSVLESLLRMEADQDDEDTVDSGAEGTDRMMADGKIVKLRDVIEIGAQDVVITASLRAILVEAAKNFDLQVIDDTSLQHDTTRLQRHVGLNDQRLRRGKVKMRLPKEAATLKRLCAEERERARENNRKIAISILLKYERSRLSSESSARIETAMLSKHKKNQARNLLVMTFVQNVISDATNRVRKMIVVGEKKRQRRLIVQTKAKAIILRVWRLYRFKKLQHCILAFIRFRKYYDAVTEHREEQAFRVRARRRAMKEDVELKRYIQRGGKILITNDRKGLTDFPYPRGHVNEEDDAIAEWLLYRFSLSKKDWKDSVKRCPATIEIL